MFIKNASKREQEGAAKHRPAGGGVRQELHHFLLEVQEARQGRVHADPTGLHHGFLHHGHHWLHDQACLHPNQQHHPFLITRQLHGHPFNCALSTSLLTTTYFISLLTISHTHPTLATVSSKAYEPSSNFKFVLLFQ